MAIEWDFDPQKKTGIKVKRENLDDALEEVATFVKEQILSNTADGKTSVKGGRWVRSLTKEYAKRKSEESSANYANLELTGEMLDALETAVDGRRIKIEIADPEQEGKAEGHLTGQYGSNSRIRPRQFMPWKRGEELSPDIMQGVKEILSRYEEEE